MREIAKLTLYLITLIKKTFLSRFLERQISRRVDVERKKRAAATKTRLEDIEEPGAITIRIVMAQDNELYPRFVFTFNHELVRWQ